MHTNESQQIFKQLGKVLKRRKLIVIGCVVGILIPIVYLNETMAPIYEAQTMLVFEEFVGGLSAYEYDASREVLIFNRVEEIKSLAFAEELAQSLSEDILQKVALPQQRSPELDVRSYLSEKIQKNISAMPVSKSNIVRISVQWPDPHLAMTFANAAAQIFLDRNDRIRHEGVGNIRQFIEDQLDRASQELNAAEEALKRFKQENRIASFNREAEEILKRLTEAEVLYNQVTGQRESTQRKLSTIQQKIAEQKKDFVPLITDLSNPWTEKLRVKLVELQSQMADLKVKGYSDTHPQVLQLERQIVETQKALTSEAMKQLQSGTFTDPQMQLAEYVSQSFALQVELQAYEAQAEALEKIISDYERQLGDLPDKEYNLVKLTRERDAKSATYLNLLQKLQEARISEAEKVSGIRVIDHARLPEKPIKPRKALNLTIGFILGSILGLGIGFVLELHNKTLDSTEELENLTQWPVLASIPRMDKASVNGGHTAHKNGSAPRTRKENATVDRALVTRSNPKSGVAEAYRMLRTNLQFHGIGHKCKTLLFTSIGPDEGKSTTAANLAITLANLGLRVLAIDADLRKPIMHAFFDLEKEPGLSELLVNQNMMNHKLSVLDDSRSLLGDTVKNEGMGDLVDNFSDFVLDDQFVSNVNNLKGRNILNVLNSALVEAIQPTDVDNLRVLTSGKQLKNPSETVSSAAMKSVLEETKAKFDVVVIDSAPLMLVPETMVLSALVDGVVFVVDSRKYDSELLLKARALLQKAEAEVLGAVINHVELNGIYKTDYYYQA